MSDTDDALALGRVRDLLQDAADAGKTLVTLDNLRAVLGPAADRRPPAPARAPQPGDTVLIRATVIPPERPLAGDMLAVAVAGLTSSVEMEIRTGAVHEVLGPPWYPPRPGDVVVDVRGDMWGWSHDGHEWLEIRYEWMEARSQRRHGKRRLAELYGPLTLLARDGKRWEG